MNAKKSSRISKLMRNGWVLGDGKLFHHPDHRWLFDDASNPNPVIAEGFKKDPYGFIQDVLKEPDRLVLNAFLYYKNSFKYVYTSLSTIAQDTGLSYNQVVYAVKKLFSYGLIGKIRHTNKSSNYYFNFVFALDFIRKKLCNLLPALRIRSLIVFFSLQTWINSNNEKAYISGFFLGSIKKIQDDIVKEEYYKEKSQSKNPYIPFDFNSLDDISIPSIEKKDLREKTSCDIPGGHEVSPFFHKWDGWSSINNDEVGKGSSMKHEIPVYVKDIRSINLTDYGRICLAPFPEKAISAIDMQLYRGRKNGMENVFGYFVSSCKRYCDTNNLKPNWNLEMSLKAQYNCPLDTPKVKDNVINHPVKEKMETVRTAYSDPNIMQKLRAQAQQIKELNEDYTPLEGEYRAPTVDEARARIRERNNIESSEWGAYLETPEGSFLMEIEEQNQKYHGSTFKAFLKSEYGKRHMAALPSKARVMMQKFLPPDVQQVEKVEPVETKPTALFETTIPGEHLPPFDWFRIISNWKTKLMTPQNENGIAVLSDNFSDETIWEEVM